MSVLQKTGRVPGDSRLTRRAGGTGLGIFAVLCLLMQLASPAHAVFSGPSPGEEVPLDVVEITMTGTGPGTAVTGGLPPVGAAFDPTTGYPADLPAGYETANEPFAGIITTVDQAGNTQQMYCIDIRTATYTGLGYENGSWEESNVPNIGYVNRVLNSYYPDVPGAPPGPPTDAIRAAAVQAAVWFFSDGYVLQDTDPVRQYTAAIVADVLAAGPLTEPPAPDVSIAPPVAAGPVDGATGPFTVTAGGGATLTVTVPDGFTLYTDPAGTVPLVEGTPVASGTQLWVRSDTQTTAPAVITAEAVVPVETGNVYLYAGNNPTVTAAQKLILAASSSISSTAQATAEFFQTGVLTVNKTFAGDAVGQQGTILLNIDCGNGFTFQATIEAGSTEDQSATFTDIPLGSTCIVTEPETGSTTAVEVVSTAPQEVVIEANSAVTVSNTVSFRPGALNVTKTITGNAAGLQSEIVLDVVCGTVLDTSVVIPAGTAAGPYGQTFTDIPAGTECTVTESSTGATSEVTVDVGDPVTVVIEPGTTVSAGLTNTVQYANGSLQVTKIVAGNGAGQQSASVLNVVCGNELEQVVRIPAETLPGEYVQVFDGIPAGTECTVTEPTSGENGKVTVETVLPYSVVIVSGETVGATVTNTYAVLGKDTLAKTGASGTAQISLAGAGALLIGTLLVAGATRRRKV
jgi:hypothetical protein